MWKTCNGSKATYMKLIEIFELAGCQEYADKVKEISEISEISEVSKHQQVKQPPTYPKLRPQPISVSQCPPATSKSVETYYFIYEESLPDGM